VEAEAFAEGGVDQRQVALHQLLDETAAPRLWRTPCPVPEAGAAEAEEGRCGAEVPAPAGAFNCCP
jgi:hypothetical protein